MITLELADPTRYDAWKAAVEEFEGAPMDGSGFHVGDARDTSPAGFEAYLTDRARQRDRSIEPHPGRVQNPYFRDAALAQAEVTYGVSTDSEDVLIGNFGRVAT